MAEAIKKRRFKFPRGTLFRCWGCPPDHPGWMRSKLRKFKGRDYCLEHRPQRKFRPICPKCANDEFPDFFKWRGSADNTLACCMVCGFEDLAIKYCTRVDIRVLAAPIDRQGEE
jgi:hypothetical protein